jgi:hypothetical protein
MTVVLRLHLVAGLRSFLMTAHQANPSDKASPSNLSNQ